jgi:microcystin-dependent protein
VPVGSRRAVQLAQIHIDVLVQFILVWDRGIFDDPFLIRVLSEEHMSDPFIAEIRMMSFNFPPKGWALCNGQFLAINQNQALFSLLGTTYGGNGTTTFALPDLQGRTPIHVGQGHVLGERAGEQAHTLTQVELPSHVHLAQASPTDGSQVIATNNYLGAVNQLYGAPTNLATLASGEIGGTGGSQAHLNMQPYLTVSFCIALVGIFPSRN